VTPECAAVVARLQSLLAAPPLTAVLSGGGLVQPGTISWDRVLLIDRAEVETVLRLLGAEPAADNSCC
jgi:hypothetical protein